MNHTDAKTRARMPHEGEPDTLLQRFTEPPEDAGLYLFYTPADMQVSEREISDFVRTQAARGVRCIVPRLAPALERGLLPPLPDVPIAADQQDAVRAAEATRAEENDRATLAFYRHVYAVLMETAHRHKIKVAFHIEQPIEQMVVRAARGSGMRAYMLTRREYYLNQEQSVSVLLCDKGKRLSVVAVDLRDGETVDLREMVDKNSLLRWDVPTGNWCVQEFICRLGIVRTQSEEILPHLGSGIDLVLSRRHLVLHSGKHLPLLAGGEVHGLHGAQHLIVLIGEDQVAVFAHNLGI